MIAPVLCWDIDGTLLTTGRAGVYALEKAALEITGRPLDLQGMPTAGLTDVEITRLILKHHGVDDTDDQVARFLRIYEDDLPASLHRKQGQVMSGVRPILEALRTRPAWRSMLLTGNTRRGAEAKLRHYGLAEFFVGGAFSDGTTNRKQIAERAVALIQARRPGIPWSHIIVIGDTPHDIACARAVGARCLGVATGGYSVAALREHGPDAAVPRLPPPGEFFPLCEKLCG
jgi:phosphoglycolate phosphatase-like HAD superfamily hydrolase